MKYDLDYEVIEPDNSLVLFVERFWSLKNLSDTDKEIIVIPDGRVDIVFTKSPCEPFRAALIGLETTPSKHVIETGTIMFGVSLKLLSVEYLIGSTISDIINSIKLLPNNYWGILENDLNNFELFCDKVNIQIKNNIKTNIDPKKIKLFKLAYDSNNPLTIAEISNHVAWSSRQINRYFNQYYGIPLKTFSKIIRFRASFLHINQGKLFPEQNFSDQAHFIKEIKKFTGVTPKELFKNKNDRFLQFSTLYKS